MVAQMQAILAAYQAVSDDALALKGSRGTLSAQLPTFHAQYTSLKVLLTGVGSPLLAKFGLKPKGRARSLTAVQRMAAQVKSAATRKLRGTLGRKAKQALVFNGTVAVTSTATPVGPPPAGIASAVPTPVASSGATPVLPAGAAPPVK